MGIIIGDFVELNRVITEDLVLEFAKLSNDYNPIHFEDEAAREQGYNRRIAHGMLIGSFFSRIIGTELPGDGSIYVSQSLNFCRPIYVCDEIKLVVTVINIDYDTCVYTLKTQCFNKDNKITVDGTAKVINRKLSKDND